VVWSGESFGDDPDLGAFWLGRGFGPRFLFITDGNDKVDERHRVAMTASPNASLGGRFPS
jgi:hypothetical protein